MFSTVVLAMLIFSLSSLGMKSIPIHPAGDVSEPEGVGTLSLSIKGAMMALASASVYPLSTRYLTPVLVAASLLLPAWRYILPASTIAALTLGSEMPGRSPRPPSLACNLDSSVSNLNPNPYFSLLSAISSSLNAVSKYLLRTSLISSRAVGPLIKDWIKSLIIVLSWSNIDLPGALISLDAGMLSRNSAKSVFVKAYVISSSRVPTSLNFSVSYSSSVAFSKSCTL